MGLAGVVPIILNCYVGHQSVHGVMSMLQPYSTPDMKRVLASSLAMACAIFLALALGGVAAFGPGVDANILNNLSASGMAPLVGSGLAQVRRGGGCHAGRRQGGPQPGWPAGWQARAWMDGCMHAC